MINGNLVDSWQLKLLEIINNLALSLNADNQADLLLDFAKAFDKVSH